MKEKLNKPFEDRKFASGLTLDERLLVLEACSLGKKKLPPAEVWSLLGSWPDFELADIAVIQDFIDDVDPHGAASWEKVREYIIENVKEERVHFISENQSPSLMDYQAKVVLDVCSQFSLARGREMKVKQSSKVVEENEVVCRHGGLLKYPHRRRVRFDITRIEAIRYDQLQREFHRRSSEIANELSLIATPNLVDGSLIDGRDAIVIASNFLEEQSHWVDKLQLRFLKLVFQLYPGFSAYRAEKVAHEILPSIEKDQTEHPTRVERLRYPPFKGWENPTTEKDKLKKQASLIIIERAEKLIEENPFLTYGEIVEDVQIKEIWKNARQKYRIFLEAKLSNDNRGKVGGKTGFPLIPPRRLFRNFTTGIYLYRDSNQPRRRR